MNPGSRVEWHISRGNLLVKEIKEWALFKDAVSSRDSFWLEHIPCKYATWVTQEDCGSCGTKFPEKLAQFGRMLSL